MRASKRFARKLKQRLDSKQNAMERIPAVMGDGAGNLFVSGQNDYVYCSIGGQPAAVYNNRVINQIGLAVWVGRTPEEPNLLQVLSTRSATPGGENNSVGFAPAKRYEWHAPNGGQDPLAVHLRAITFLRLGVSGTTNTASTLYADLYRGWVHTSAGFINIPRQNINLFTHIPSTANKAAMVLITIDDAGAVIQTKGAEVDIDALTIADVPEVPAGTAFLCGAIRVYNGQTEIQDGRTNTDIWDGRFSWMSGASGSGNLTFAVDGRLAVSTNVPNAIVITKATVISEVYAYVKTTGSASSTIIDVNKNGTTIYTTQANRPTIAYNDANGWVNTSPDVLSFDAGDIITLDIDQVATGASDLVVVLSVSGTSGGVSLKNEYVLVREERTAGTAGGTFTAGSWVTRVINTEVFDTGNNCTLPGSNVIRLQAGTYDYRITAPASFVAGHKCRFYDVTGAAVVTGSSGTSEAANTNPMNTRSFDMGRFTITAENDFRVEHYAKVTNADDGLGSPSNFGEAEVYTTAEFWRIA